MSYFCIFLIIALTLVNNINICSANKCVQEGACMCKFDEYSQINLTQLLPSKTKFIQDSEGNYTYFFSGCIDKNFDPQEYKLNSTAVISGSLIKCVEVLGKYNITINSTTVSSTYVAHNCTAIGDSKKLKYVLTSDSSNSYQIIYDQQKSGSSPSIRLVCDNFNSTDLKIASYESDVLTLYSPLVCVKHLSPHGLSTGSIFCILFFTTAFIYFVGGGIIMYTARGARGAEVLPNYDFWVSLPGLMRDGMVFILSGCRPFTVTTAETYDRI